MSIYPKSGAQIISPKNKAQKEGNDMARPKKDFPTPHLSKRQSTFRIRWYAFKNWFEISLGRIEKKDAERITSVLNGAFATNDDYPEEIRHESAIKRYIALTNNLDITTEDGSLIERYLEHLKVKCKSSWPKAVKAYLNNALKFIGTLQDATPAQINEYLDTIARRNTPATSNRAYAGLSGFFTYLRKVGHMPKNYNPMREIKQLREERPHNGIVIWEPAEVKQLLKAADERKDGIAVWIAILAGLRRGEIAQLRREDITDAYIIVGKSKTGVKRQVPLSSALAKRIQTEPSKGERIVPWPEKFYGWDIAARRLATEHLPKALPAVYDAHPEKFGWNPFRHTFASRHAQAGLSLDIIAAWLGDSPKVCKEHYARYVPRNLRDTRIDAADPEI